MLASQCIQRSPPSFTPVNDGREVAFGNISTPRGRVGAISRWVGAAL
jgi:hypothetical protein